MKKRKKNSRWEILKILPVHHSVELEGLKQASVASGVTRASRRLGMQFTIKTVEKGILITRIS